MRRMTPPSPKQHNRLSATERKRKSRENMRNSGQGKGKSAGRMAIHRANRAKICADIEWSSEDILCLALDLQFEKLSPVLVSLKAFHTYAKGVCERLDKAWKLVPRNRRFEVVQDSKLFYYISRLFNLFNLDPSKGLEEIEDALPWARSLNLAVIAHKSNGKKSVKGMLLEVVSSLLSKGLEVGKSLGSCKVARASFLAAGGLGLVLRLHRRATTQPSHRGCDNRALLVVVAVLKEGIHGIEWEDLKTCVKVLCYSMISKGAVHCISSEDAGKNLTREARKVVIDLSDGLVNECLLGTDFDLMGPTRECFGTTTQIELTHKDAFELNYCLTFYRVDKATRDVLARAVLLFGHVYRDCRNRWSFHQFDNLLETITYLFGRDYAPEDRGYVDSESKYLRRSIVSYAIPRLTRLWPCLSDADVESAQKKKERLGGKLACTEEAILVANLVVVLFKNGYCSNEWAKKADLDALHALSKLIGEGVDESARGRGTSKLLKQFGDLVTGFVQKREASKATGVREPRSSSRNTRVTEAVATFIREEGRRVGRAREAGSKKAPEPEDSIDDALEPGDSIEDAVLEARARRDPRLVVSSGLPGLLEVPARRGPRLVVSSGLPGPTGWFTAKEWEKETSGGRTSRIRERLRTEAEISHDLLVMYGEYPGLDIRQDIVCSVCRSARSMLAAERSLRTPECVRTKKEVLAVRRKELFDLTNNLNFDALLTDELRVRVEEIVSGSGTLSRDTGGGTIIETAVGNRVFPTRSADASVVLAAKSVRAALDELEDIQKPLEPVLHDSCAGCAYGRGLDFVTTRLLRVFTTGEAYRLMDNFATAAGPELFDRTHGCGSCGRAMSRLVALADGSSLPWLPGSANRVLDQRQRRALSHCLACEDCRGGRDALCKYRVLSSGYLGGGTHAVLSPLLNPLSPYELSSFEVRNLALRL